MGRLVHEIYTFGNKVEKIEAEYIVKVQEKLAHYEDLEEQGRLIEQKYGTWLAVTFNKVMCSECNHIWNIMNNDVETFEHCPKCGVKMLTKEEAEAKLKELEGVK